MEKKEMFSRIIEILGWGFILLGILFVISKVVGIIGSPSELSLDRLIGLGIVLVIADLKVSFGKFESKIDLMWTDFKKRKKL